MSEVKSQSRIEDSMDGPLVSGVRTAEEAARRFRDNVVSGAKDRLEDSRGYIRENPVQTVLIAAGVGALVGFLIASRRS